MTYSMTQEAKLARGDTASAQPTIARRALTVCVTVAAAMLLSGCGEDPTADLKPWVSSVLERRGKPLEDLPPIRPYVVYKYQSSQIEDPFTPFYQTIIEEAERAISLANEAAPRWADCAIEDRVAIVVFRFLQEGPGRDRRDEAIHSLLDLCRDVQCRTRDGANVRRDRQAG